MEFNNIPTAEIVEDGYLPTAEPILQIITWKEKLQRFLKSRYIDLDPIYIDKMTDFSYDQKWNSSYIDDSHYTEEGNFVLNYTCMGEQVKLIVEYLHSQTQKTRFNPIIKKKIQLTGTFPDEISMGWHTFKMDTKIDINHPLWFIYKLRKRFIGSYHLIMTFT